MRLTGRRANAYSPLMSRRQKQALAILLLLLLLLLLLFLFWRKKHAAQAVPAPLPVDVHATLPMPPTPPPVVKPPRPIETAHPVTTPPKPPPTPVVIPVTPSTQPTPSPVVPTPLKPSQAGTHPELIPKNITIVRIYFEQPVVGPGTQFDFDINGSGFDVSFQQMISVDFDALDIEPKNLRLVTANQIHGTVSVGDAATTQYIYPQVMIRGLPVFRAEEPFGVVRPGEVLDIQLTNIDDTGQMGEFRVTTNLTKALYSRFRLEPTTPRLELGMLTPKLPFYVDGVVRIQPGLSSGEYGLKTFMGNHALFKKDPLVDVVHPDIGRTGTIENVKAEQPAHRPGDELSFIIKGSGFTSAAAGALVGKIEGFDMGNGQVTYLTAGELRLNFHIPANAPTGLYGVDVLQKGKPVYQRKTAFAIVPANWLNGVKLLQPIRPGQRGVVQLTGRDLSAGFIQLLTISTDEPGITLSPPRLQDLSTAALDVRVSSDVAPGDYILHVSVGAKPLKLAGGNIIKITQ
jgi:hypothetical protein